MSYGNIPAELQSIAHWINWKYEKITDKEGNARTTKIPLRAIDGKRASVTNPLDWTDFNTACNAAQFCDGIGFVFTKSDPYCGIDLDDAKGDGNVVQRQKQILTHLSSYTEFSPSGKGLHIITRAVLPGTGKRRGGIECYDDRRFFTMTGNVYLSIPISDKQNETVAVYDSLGPTLEHFEQAYRGEDRETHTDAEVIANASVAKNGDKFMRLYKGDWKDDYLSQSEADFSLINILTFYSRNANQTVRLFRNSGLGKREKGKRVAYVNGMVRRSFDRMQPRVSVMQIGGTWFDAHDFEPWSVPPALLAAAGAPYVPPLPPANPVLGAGYSPPPRIDGLPAIPGLVGELAAHCWRAATYPIAEVSVASALASMSLLAGRTHRVGTSGLSLYLLLLAKTSTGKSFAYQAQSAWRAALLRRYDNPGTGNTQAYKIRKEYIQNMIVGKIGSGPGIAQQMLRSPTTLMQLDEFVKDIKRIGHRFAAPNDIAIQQEILSLVDASHPGGVFYEKRYSDRTSKREPVTVQSPCLTILGTGTPEEFFDDMNNSLLEGGFLPRFTIMSYDGTLPDENETPDKTVSDDMLRQIMQLFELSFALNQEIDGALSQLRDVVIDTDAATLLRQFKFECQDNVRQAHAQNLPVAGLWSRAQMHVTQIAGLIAVGVNPFMPTMQASYVQIAKDIVLPSLMKLCGKVTRDEIGEGDTRCEADVKRYIDKLTKWETAKGYPNSKYEICSAGYCSLVLLRNCCVKLASFKNTKIGALSTFDMIIRSMLKYNAIRQFRFADCEVIEIVKNRG